ncbi:MAG: transketolase [Alphaproteobacteria bacterium]|nr:transketolase [Alphaproteobacteria bacterium]MBN2780017.1 transketolase [Alphaproteobacteria bacterium]
MEKQNKLNRLANAIRFLSVDMVNMANSGHPGAPLGLADLATVLFSKHLNFNPEDPKWPNRDRFILSNGHASALLYSLFYLTGYEDCTLDELKNFRQINSKTAGHPEYGLLNGTETTTGPLAQGIATAVGIALGEKITRERKPESGINHKTYVIVGDGCLAEGLSYEATAFAGHQKLNNLIVLWDNNSITIDGDVRLARSENMQMRFESIGWKTLKCDAHDTESIETALVKAQTSQTPVFIDCKTIIAKGCTELEGSEKSHGSPIGGALRVQMAQDLEESPVPFDVPKDILNEWRNIGKRSIEQYNHWMEQYSKQHQKKPVKVDSFEKSLNELKQAKLENQKKEATRSTFQSTLPALLGQFENLIGGSADLTPSNKTSIKEMSPITPNDAKGNYIHYGVREHAMGAIMNGLSLYGFRPYGGTFMMFLDYMKPAVRLAALMKQPIIYVATHDSIEVGEDGPTHQPIEHLESLRAVPNLNVFRPCDSIEAIECIEIAFEETKTPSILALSREELPLVRSQANNNLSRRGGYIIKSCSQSDIILIASGSDVKKALAISEMLFKNRGIYTCVLSMPCQEIFDKQDETYKQKVLPVGAFKIAIESSTPNAWYKYADFVFGIEEFGYSGKPEDVRHKMHMSTEQIYIEIAKLAENL